MKCTNPRLVWLPSVVIWRICATPVWPPGTRTKLASLRGQQALQVRAGIARGSGCGALPEYEHAKVKNFEEARSTFYNPETEKTEPVVFKAGDIIDYKCEAGFTTDGSKDGVDVYGVECMEHGYYTPHGVCIKASKCGPVPDIAHAMPTGKVVRGRAEFACAQGYSLDGKKVVAGGMGRNRFFELECVEFSGSYKDFAGECKPYAFAPATETIRIYNQVSEALFIVSCKGSLRTAFAKGEAPQGLASVCDSFGESGAACAGLIAEITGQFESELAARKAHDESEKKEWHEEKSPDRPNINDEAQTFCTELWKLLEMPDF